MINPPHSNKRKIVASRSHTELGQGSGPGSPQKLTLHQLLNIDSVLPAPKEVRTGKQGK